MPQVLNYLFLLLLLYILFYFLVRKNPLEYFSTGVFGFESSGDAVSYVFLLVSVSPPSNDESSVSKSCECDYASYSNTLNAIEFSYAYL